jgi:hypothetical protein
MDPRVNRLHNLYQDVTIGRYPGTLNVHDWCVSDASKTVVLAFLSPRMGLLTPLHVERYVPDPQRTIAGM